MVIKTKNKSNNRNKNIKKRNKNKSIKINNRNLRNKRKITRNKRKTRTNQKGGNLKLGVKSAISLMSSKDNVKESKATETKTSESKTKRDLSKCAPDNQDNDFSCFSRDALMRMVYSWNNSCADDQKIQVKPSMKLSEIWQIISDKLKSKCDTEWCWLEQDIAKDNKYELKKLFRPKMPSKWYKHPREWLTTTDIENVMKQYERKHKDFKFIGPVPIDFDHELSPGNCVAQELCKIDIKNLIKNNKHKLGVIFNLDPHDEPGSHWVAMYADVKKGGVYYFDSYGVEPPDEVNKLMDRLSKQGKDLNNNIKIKVNKVRHQFKNSECGVYSMNFIINLLNGKTYEELTNNVVKDDTMLKNRDVYFVRY